MVSCALLFSNPLGEWGALVTVPSDSVASYLLWKHFSSPLRWGQQRKGSSLKCVSAKQTETGWPRCHSPCLSSSVPLTPSTLPRILAEGPSGKESLSGEQSSHAEETTGSCHPGWSQLAISRSHWCSPFRAKRTWLDFHPAAMGEGCRVVSSKVDDSGVKHNYTFLSRYGKAYTA